jgi:tRNA nucleotidyltransferase (CCA-adding enzyme)
MKGVKNVNLILKGVLYSATPKAETNAKIKELVENFIGKLDKQLKKSKVKAESFVGGSFAKGTMIKEGVYDIDVFVRFDLGKAGKKGDADISKTAEKVLKKFAREYRVIHGSRDYFEVKAGKDLYIELIPVVKVSNPKNALNITDLSYSHVKYVNKKLKKNKKLADNVRLAKSFCYANGVYGAESYINGFSGYGLELLIIHYGSFTRMLRELAKISRKGGDRIVIDMERAYKNKQQILMDVSSSKIQGPIVLIDPTFKQRNALAALTWETFEKFQAATRGFLKKPSAKFFAEQVTDLNKVQANAKKKKNEFILLEAKTNKQTGDVAGSKLLKFHRALDAQISRFFEVKDRGFNYNNEKAARYFFVVKSRGNLLIAGPSVKDVKHVKAFKKRHTKTVMKKGRVYAREKVKLGIRKFVDSWVKKNKKIVKEMSITSLRVLS